LIDQVGSEVECELNAILNYLALPSVQSLFAENENDSTPDDLVEMADRITDFHRTNLELVKQVKGVWSPTAFGGVLDTTAHLTDTDFPDSRMWSCFDTFWSPGSMPLQD
jgi:hypothetical protein